MAVSLGSDNRSVQQVLDQNTIYQANKERYDDVLSESHRSATVSKAQFTVGYVVQGFIEVAKRVSLIAFVIIPSLTVGLTGGAISAIVFTGIVGACCSNQEIRSKFGTFIAKSELFACLTTKLKVIKIVAEVLPQLIAIPIYLAAIAKGSPGVAKFFGGLGLMLAVQSLADDVIHLIFLAIEKWHAHKVAHITFNPPANAVPA